MKCRDRFRAALSAQRFHVGGGCRGIAQGGGGPGIEKRNGENGERPLGGRGELLAHPRIILVFESGHGQRQARAALVGRGFHNLGGVTGSGIEIAGGAGIEKRQIQQIRIAGIAFQALGVIAFRLRHIMLSGGETRRKIGRESVGGGVRLRRLGRGHDGASRQQQTQGKKNDTQSHSYIFE